MVAHGGLDVGYREFLVRYDPQRHRLCSLIAPLSPGQITVHSIGIAIEETPHTGITDPASTEIGKRVGITVGEIGILAVVPSSKASIADHIFREEHIARLIVHIETRYTALVGMSTDGIVRDAQGHPHSTALRQLATGSLLVGRHRRAHHLHDPCLVRVAYSKRLAL